MIIVNIYIIVLYDYQIYHRYFKETKELRDARGWQHDELNSVALLNNDIHLTTLTFVIFTFITYV